MHRRTVLLGTLGLAAQWPARAQARVARIGILSARSRSTPQLRDVYFDAFLSGMRELGYVEGKNLQLEWRFADGRFDRLPALAAELVKTKPDIIVSHSTPGTLALQKITKTVPIVITSLTDPVGSGLVASLAKPGGNITGLSIRADDVTPKQIELLQQIIPGLSRLGVLMNPDTAFHPRILNSMQALAQRLNLRVLPVQARTVGEIAQAMEKLARDGAQAVVVLSDSFFSMQRHAVGAASLKNRLVQMYVDRILVEAGGMISYGTNVAESYRRAAGYVDRILKGAKPAELPIEEPASYDLAINRSTAKALGVKIPSDLLVRANELID